MYLLVAEGAPFWAWRLVKVNGYDTVAAIFRRFAEEYSKTLTMKSVLLESGAVEVTK